MSLILAIDNVAVAYMQPPLLFGDGMFGFFASLRMTEKVSE